MDMSHAVFEPNEPVLELNVPAPTEVAEYFPIGGSMHEELRLLGDLLRSVFTLKH